MMKHTGRSFVLSAGALTALCISAGTAQAAVFNWNFTPGEPQPPGGSYVISNAGGTIHSMSATFNDVSRQLSFTANFSDRVTRGFFMALNNGPMPRPRPGELGMFYFDAGDVFDGGATQDIVLTAYAYNGANDGSTWFDGDGATPGVQPPDVIRSALDTTWITSTSAGDVVLPGGINGRSFNFVVDAGPIISHVPLYPDSGGGSWYGAGFDLLLGIWFHPFANQFDMTYDAQGRIATWDYGPQGWLDATNLIVPAPGALAVLGLGMGLAAGRRRRAN